jgi:hypothetical protein
VFRDFAFPFAGDVEQVNDHVRLEEGPGCLLDLLAAARAARGVGGQQAVVDRVIEGLGEDVQDHVDRPRRERLHLPVRVHVRPAELQPKLVDRPGVKLARRPRAEVGENMIKPPPVVKLRVRRELGLPALPPPGDGEANVLGAVDGDGGHLGTRGFPGAALDAGGDPLELGEGALLVPAFVVGAEVDPVTLAVDADPGAVGDGAAVLPPVRLETADRAWGH